MFAAATVSAAALGTGTGTTPVGLNPLPRQTFMRLIHAFSDAKAHHNA